MQQPALIRPVCIFITHWCLVTCVPYVTGTLPAKSLFQRGQSPSNRSRRIKRSRRISWRRVVLGKSSRNQLESSFRAGAARSRHRSSLNMCGDRRRSSSRVKGWSLLKGRQTADGRRQTADGSWDGGGQTAAKCRLPFVFPPSADCRPPTAVRRLPSKQQRGKPRERFPPLLLRRPTSSSRPSSFQPFSWPFSWLPWFNLL